MNASMWAHDDDQLLAEIKQAMAERSDVPERAIDAALAAFELRTVDAEYELLTLLYDSRLDGAALVRGESSDTLRRLSFEGGGLLVELELGREFIVGQLVPTINGSAMVETRTEPARTVDIDDLGCFLIRRPTGGQVRFRCQGPTAAMTTDWIDL